MNDSVVTIPASAFRHVRRAAIIDDDPVMQLLLSDILQDLSIEVAVWSDGSEQHLLQSFDPDLILLDIKLGVSDAFTILRSEIPPSYRGVVSIVSAMGIDAVMDAMLLGERRGLRLGPPVLKPFGTQDVMDLVSEANELLERRSIGEWALIEQEATPIGQDLRLRQALDEGLLEVWYQPKMDVATGFTAGAEALIRAHATNGEIISPYVLLRDAAKNELEELTDYLLKIVVGHGRALVARGFRKKLSVNVPASYICQSDPCRVVREASKSQEWPGLIFEITEDEALHDIVDVQLIATQLRLYSVSLSIDDFGTAYSSLSRLRDLPFTELKLDRSFVHDCATDSTRRSICASVLALGAELGVTTVAEGVESEAEMAFLAGLGCNQVQGYLFAKPMPFGDLLNFVQSPRSRRAVGKTSAPL